MAYTITRRITFCAGHRVFGHESKCRNLHGHNYTVLFDAQAEQLDELGRVIDFAVLKERLKAWIDEYWDHGLILMESDPIVPMMTRSLAQKCYLLPQNPTAENLAEHLLHHAAPEALEGVGVRVVRVTLWETENCCAMVEL